MARRRSKILLALASISVRHKLSATLVMVLAGTVASLGWVTYSRQKRILADKMRKHAEVLVQQLASVGKEGLLTQQELDVYSAIQSIHSNPDVVYAMVLDADGRVFAHSQLSQKGKRLRRPVDRSALGANELLFQNHEYRDNAVLDASLPIYYKAKNIRLGTARIGLSENEFWTAVGQQKIMFFWLLVTFVSVGLLVSLLLARILTRPIYSLAVAMQVAAKGDVSRQMKVFYRDEIGKLTESFNQMVLSLREKLHMEKYLSYTTLKRIRQNRSVTALRLGGEREYVTVLFSDVRGFTAMSESMSPEEVVELLNIYLNLQSKVIHQRDGAVDKFVGDQVMAIFEGENQKIQAVRAAVEIQRYCKILNACRRNQGKREMMLGIGINSGDVIMGNIGSEDQMDYTVIGDSINVAARLCSAARGGQILISPAVAENVAGESTLRKLEPIQVKGKIQPIPIWEVQDTHGASREFMRRGAEVQAYYRNADSFEPPAPAVARDISASGCMLEVQVQAAVGTRLNVELYFEWPGYTLKVPCVVRRVQETESRYRLGLEFEQLKEIDRERLIEWVHQIATDRAHILEEAQP